MQVETKKVTVYQLRKYTINDKKALKSQKKRKRKKKKGKKRKDRRENN